MGKTFASATLIGKSVKNVSTVFITERHPYTNYYERLKICNNFLLYRSRTHTHECVNVNRKNIGKRTHKTRCCITVHGCSLPPFFSVSSIRDFSERSGKLRSPPARCRPVVIACTRRSLLSSGCIPCLYDRRFVGGLSRTSTALGYWS